MSTVSTGTLAKRLFPGVNAWYMEAVADFEEQHSLLFDVSTTERYSFEDIGIVGSGLMPVKPEGSPISFDTISQGFIDRYTMVAYALGINITHEMVMDDLYDSQGKQMSKYLGRSGRKTRDIVGTNIYNDAFNGAVTYGDGVALISAAHPLETGGTWSNRPAAFADLSEATLEQAVIDIGGFPDGNGINMEVIPTQLIVTRSDQFNAHRILFSDLRSGSANHDTNAIKDMNLFKNGFTVGRHLSDANAWFVRTDVEEGMKYVEREAEKLFIDNEFTTMNAQYMAYSRYAFGASNKRGIYGNSGT